jgi:hypothetical protein
MLANGSVNLGNFEPSSMHLWAMTELQQFPSSLHYRNFGGQQRRSFYISLSKSAWLDLIESQIAKTSLD